jgi:hypothetical protein
MIKVIALIYAICICALTVSAQTWIDISSALINSQGITPGYPGGCSGAAVNRITGDAMIVICGFGVWKSSDQGTNWTRIDNGTVSGRGAGAWSFQVDQNDPRRMAVFPMEGDAGYTTDGITWKKMTGIGRNWDFGSVDWATQDAKVILVSKHESGGQVYKSTDGGTTWTMLSITVDASANMDGCMLGVLDKNTFIYSFGNGIRRSTDQGATWTQVSTLQPRSKIPVLFKGAHYLCTSGGLIVSKDMGATWELLGSAVSLWQGPFFGADENIIVTVGPLGIYKTINTGVSWTRIASLPPNVNGQTIDGSKFFEPKWFGCFSWDPINNIVYASRMVEPAFKYEVPSVAVNRERVQRIPGDKLSCFSFGNQSIMVTAPAGAKWELDLFTLDGALSNHFSGQGSEKVPCFRRGDGFVISRLHARLNETVLPAVPQYLSP